MNTTAIIFNYLQILTIKTNSYINGLFFSTTYCIMLINILDELLGNESCILSPRLIEVQPSI